MGIQGLLPLLKDIQVKTSILNFKGQTVGIDAYCWLHKGAYACAQDLVMGKPTRIYVHYVLKRVKMLISHNVTPILVFDGGHLPAKSEKEKERRQRRKENREKGLAALREGKSSEAFDAFQKSCDITPEMASNVIEECYKLNVKCIVAPYEADAQLAYLMLQGITQLTISEDSDLLLYGCNKVLYKMSVDGDGFLIDMSNLSKVRTIKLVSFTREQFRWMCMLSGCDYLPSIKGMGLVKAHKLLERHKTIKQCIRALKIDRNLFVPDDYEDNFRKAELVFKFQLVFDPKERKAVPLNNVAGTEINAELTDEDRKYAGPFITQIKAISIALGNVDPISGRSITSRTDFASGIVQTKPWKATSWTSAKPKLQTQPNALTKLSRPSKRIYKDTSVDLTPPNSQTMNSEETKKSLFLSPKSEAEKSLKRLRSEIAAEEVTHKDKFKRLYATQSSVSSPQQPQQTNHHSAFSFSKSKSNKFRNPFRQNIDTNTSPNTVVVSRFFNKEALTSADAASKCNKKLIIEGSPDLNGSFVDYLDQTNCRVSGMEKKDLTLKSPKRTPQQLKIDKICSSKENNVHEKKTDVGREPLSPIENIVASKNIKESLEPASNSKDGEVDFEVQDREEAECYIEESKALDEEEHCSNVLSDNDNIDNDEIMDYTVLCEDSDSDANPPSPPVINRNSQNSQICAENITRTNSQPNCRTSSHDDSSPDCSQRTKQKVKLGLSKNSCKGIGVSSFVDKKPTSQISTYLEQFRNIGCNNTRSDLPKTEITEPHSSGCTTSSSDENKETDYLSEEVLPFEAEKHVPKISSLLKTTQAAVPPRRSQPIGLRRQKNSKLSKRLSTDNCLKQSKLSFDKFAFKKKAIPTTNEDGVICIS